MPPTLFVALVPPAETLAPLAEDVERLRSQAPELAWVPPTRWHITMCFLGRLPPDDDLLARLSRVARRHPPPQLAVAGSGHFGSRVLYAKVRGELRPLATGMARAAERAGFPVEDRPFRAHLTLARARRTKVDLRLLAAQLATVQGPTWTARELVLMSGGQPEYERLASWPFSGPG